MTAPKPMNSKKILIVDDNEVILKTLALKLRAGGFEVITATDGSQAVAAARTKQPDIILLDIGFPPEVSGVPWDGFRIIQWLKRMEETRQIPVIIITGGEASKYKDRAIAEGAVAFFQKPVNNDELLATIGQVLGLPSTTENASAVESA
jgi:CheY-like chemotaxis protein